MNPVEIVHLTTHTARESIARSNQGPTPAAQLIGLLSLAHSRFLYGPVGRAAHVNARRRETPCDCSAGCSHAAAPPHLLGRPRRHGVPEATAPPPRREAGGSPRPPPSAARLLRLSLRRAGGVGHGQPGALAPEDGEGVAADVPGALSLPRFYQRGASP